MFSRRALLQSLVVSPALALLGREAAAAQRTGGATAPGKAAPPAPPVSYTCPMHAEVVEDKPGKCPICSMTLQPVRLALVWSCQVHTEVTELQAGRCRLCGRDLVRVTKAVTFRCPVHRKVDVLDP